MPRIPSADHISSRGAGLPLSDPGTGQHATSIRKKKAATNTIQVAERIESKHWHNRLISFCKKKNKSHYSPPPISESE